MTKRSYDMQRRARLEAETRERIVRATVDLHARHGPLGTSYGMIATRAQVSPQTVYNHFPTLDALLGACTSHVGSRAPPLGPETFQSGRTPAKRLELLATAVFTQHAFLAPWMRHAWYEAALIPELGAILDKSKAALRRAHRGGHRSRARAVGRLCRRSLRPSGLPGLAGTIARPIDCRGGAHRRRLPDRFAAPAYPTPTSRETVMSTNGHSSATQVDEIADGIFRISTPVPASVVPGGFTFNQYLIRDATTAVPHRPANDVPVVREAVASVMPVETLRYISFSHVEADECGTLNEWLAVAPQSVPLCGNIAAMVSIGDLADRPPARDCRSASCCRSARTRCAGSTRRICRTRGSADFCAECTTRTLLCGDLFTQPGARTPPVTETDIFGPSEAFAQQLDYYSHTEDARSLLERLADDQPTTLACMHGSAWRGDGAALLRNLALRLA